MMDIVHAARNPVLKEAGATERGKVYRLFKPTGDSLIPVDSYYLIARDESTGHMTDMLSGWYAVNLRSGMVMPYEGGG
ncbi:hypothetical protein [Stenotrophomonas phage CM2]